MPSTMTHAYMAKDIYQRLDKRVKGVFKEDYLDYYVTYSQGPDILFFYPFFPILKSIRIRKFAGIVHREKVNEFFIRLIDEIKKTKDDDKFIYLCGLVTHYVGDTTCHPFVNYKAKLLETKRLKKKDYHFKIEAYIDNYIINLKEENYKKYKGYKVLKTKENKSVRTLLDNCFLDVYQEKNMGTNYYKSLKNMKLLFYLIRYDPYKIKRICYDILYFFLKFLKRDIRYFSYNFDLSREENNFYLNLSHDVWFNVRKKEIKYNKSFLDLYEDVIQKSCFMIENLYDYIYKNQELDLESFFGNLSYANGLPIENK